jgi:thioredoxin-related protein
MKTFLLLVLFAFASDVYIPFSSAIEKAKSENKEILLVFSGSDWCKPCISLKKNIFDQQDFLTYSDEKIIFYTADFPRELSKISDDKMLQNEALAEKYNLRGTFPYLVLLDSNQKILKQHAGAFNTFSELKLWLEN